MKSTSRLLCPLRVLGYPYTTNIPAFRYARQHDRKYRSNPLQSAGHDPSWLAVRPTNGYSIGH
ncbi:Uncharacterised protein [Vibrio cholerae]|nr:Uncharacterised protein [Vibrio cholerae]